MSYNSLEEIVRECQEKDLPFDEVILLDDMNERNVSREESIETMRGMWEAMKGAERNYDGSLQSRSGLVGGAGKTMRAYVESGNTLCGPFVGKVMASALAMGESNACMKRIVAAPTAGACGVLPAVLVNYQKEKGTADEQSVRALYTAAGIGQVLHCGRFRRLPGRNRNSKRDGGRRTDRTWRRHSVPDHACGSDGIKEPARSRV